MKFRIQTTTRFLICVILLVALSLGTIKDQSDTKIYVLACAKVGVLLLATLRSRYAGGASAAWWFGFAAFGWAQHVLQTYPPWYLPPGQALAPTPPDYCKLSDISGTITVHLTPWLGPYPNADHALVAVGHVVRFWLGMATAVCGGFVSLIIASRDTPTA
jgi:hypothetical protein